MKIHFFFLLFTPIVSAINNIYGDSILSPQSPIEDNLSKIYNTSFNNYAIMGSAMDSVYMTSIPQQYNKHQIPVPKNVIMNGGGRDVFSMKSDCLKFDRKCRLNIEHVAVVVRNLLKHMITDGIQNIIYVGYYYNNHLDKAIDYGCNQLAELCIPTNHCYFVDVRNLTIPTVFDGIHPNDKGYDLITNAIKKTIDHYNIQL
jgi:hypothetical protein